MFFSFRAAIVVAALGFLFELLGFRYWWSENKDKVPEYNEYNWLYCKKDSDSVYSRYSW